MKFRRFLSGLLFGTGCALTFIGLLATLLPSLANQHMRTVLASFSADSDIAAVTAVNRFMSFALANGWQVILLGLLTAVAGGLLLHHFQPCTTSQRRRRTADKTVQPARIRSMPPSIPPVDREAPNPFAVTAYQKQQKKSAFSSRHLHAAPMLERNRIENDPQP